MIEMTSKKILQNKKMSLKSQAFRETCRRNSAFPLFFPRGFVSTRAKFATPGMGELVLIGV
jgi:hypothetical protein